MTIDADLAAALRKLAQERRISFSEAVNTTLRTAMGAQAGSTHRYRVPARRLGLRRDIDLDQGLYLAGGLEDAEIIRRLERRT